MGKLKRTCRTAATLLMVMSFWLGWMLTVQPVLGQDVAEEKFVKKIKGKYYALIIGINDYKNLRKLKTPVPDAIEVDRILRDQYGFKTILLVDKMGPQGKTLSPTRVDIIQAFNDLTKKLKEGDNVLIYYAGHGHRFKIEGLDEGDKYIAYWQPSNADPEDDANWISASVIKEKIKLMNKADHVLVVSDSCYSGTMNLTRGNEQKERNLSRGLAVHLADMHKNRSRNWMASGSDEPVLDGGGKGHSVFARFFIRGLKKPGAQAFTAESFYDEHIKFNVPGSAQQKPGYNIILRTGHRGGDFVFLVKNWTGKKIEFPEIPLDSMNDEQIDSMNDEQKRELALKLIDRMNPNKQKKFVNNLTNKFAKEKTNLEDKNELADDKLINQTLEQKEPELPQPPL